MLSYLDQVLDKMVDITSLNRRPNSLSVEHHDGIVQIISAGSYMTLERAILLLEKTKLELLTKYREYKP